MTCHDRFRMEHPFKNYFNNRIKTAGTATVPAAFLFINIDNKFRIRRRMKSYSLLESRKQNKYFYDRGTRRVQLCHPLLHHIIKSSKGAAPTAQDESAIEIENCGTFSKKEVEYYYGKYLLLKENGYFTEVDRGKILSANLTGEIIKETFANLKQVLFEATERCQMNCSYCGYGNYYRDYDDRGDKDLDTGRAKTLLNYLLESWNSPLNTSHNRDIYISFYGGEPLLNFPFVDEIVAYVKQLKTLHNRFVFSMTSNGLLIEKYMDFLYENDFDLLISLDGNEKNNAFRVLKNGSPTYKIVMRNIKALQEKYPDYFLKKVDFMAVLHSKNSVAEIFDFFKEHFDKIPHINSLNTTGIKDSQKETFREIHSNRQEHIPGGEDYSAIEKDKLVKSVDKQKTTAFLVFQNDFSFNNYNELIYRNKDKKRMPTGTCLPFSKKVFLTANGEMLPCERIGRKYGFGNVAAGKVELNFDAIAKKYNAFFDKIIKRCRMCHNADLCDQCIFHLNIDDDNPVCNGFMTEDEYALHLSSIMSFIEEQPGNYAKIIKETFFEF